MTVEITEEDRDLIITALERLNVSAIFNNITEPQSLAIEQRVAQIKAKLVKNGDNEN